MFEREVVSILCLPGCSVVVLQSNGMTVIHEFVNRWTAARSQESHDSGYINKCAEFEID